jgi:hypothetical protein
VIVVRLHAIQQTHHAIRKRFEVLATHPDVSITPGI